MLATTGAMVPPALFKQARKYVENNRVPFFEFFRNCAFGFVRVGERKGRFAQITLRDDGELECACNCGEADFDEVCAHGFALYLKLVNWPLEKKNLSAEFDQYEPCRFFKAVGRRFYDEPINAATNPWLKLSSIEIDPRLTDFWGFTEHEPAVRKRDRQCLQQAKLKARTKAEGDMMLRRFPPERVLFEESVFYPLCKLFFHLERKAGLFFRARLLEGHQVSVEARHGADVVFGWRMPVDEYLKGIRGHWDYWRERTEFEIRRLGVPIAYQIRFNERSDLEIEPMVALGGDAHTTVAATQVPGARNLFFHEKLGYFRLQTGLSPFEMTFSEPRRHSIDRQKVKKFLQEHKPALEGMDRALMDEALFGEVVVERFDRLTLHLLEPVGDGFAYALEAKLGELTIDRQTLRRTFAGEGRYKKIGGKLFDGQGYDSVYLSPFLEGEDAVLPAKDVWRALSFFKDRLEIQKTEQAEPAFRKLSEMTSPEAPSLRHTRLSLRPYQQTGYQWLYYLKTFGLGGLLCDQMGLGKTHQAMALIAASLAENPHGRALVIAPTSVLFHWKDKLAAFCPDIDAVVHHGSDRDFAAALTAAQVLITSYGSARNDIAEIKSAFFDLAVFDEIQYLKNKTTKAHTALAKVRAQCKVGLTGTPIENHIGELKSLIDLVFPGYLGHDAQFKRYFSDPILKFGDARARDQVRDMTRPFTLRRAKEQVLLELPEKVEDIRSFLLTGYQRELYLETKKKGKRGLKGESSEFMHVFQLIAKLKQICDHPGLFFKNCDYTAYPSAKWDLFTELLNETLESGQKAVVFSQYLGMVEMFQRYLADQGIGHAVITGQVKDRASQQRRFMEDEHCRVFLGTTLAAGVGIDLTSASVLIHYDRWWNAAREEQATDRIHRIGQTKNVQIFKFLAMGTVEERIDAIIRKKAALLDDIVGFDDEQAAKRFTIEELLEILG